MEQRGDNRPKCTRCGKNPVLRGDGHTHCWDCREAILRGMAQANRDARLAYDMAHGLIFKEVDSYRHLGLSIHAQDNDPATTDEELLAWLAMWEDGEDGIDEREETD